VKVGGGASTVLPQFFQNGNARDEARRRLVPWTFWFWPYGGDPDAVHAARQAADVLARFAWWSGAKDEVVEQVKQWELRYHFQKDYTYEGHCHGAANASALFREPSGGEFFNPKNARKIAFTRLELKLLATEYYTNYGQEAPVWELRGSGPMAKNRVGEDPRTLKKGGDPTLKYLLYYIEPEAIPDRDKLARRFAGDNVGDSDGWADYFHSGDQDTFEELVQDCFGDAAATYFEALLEYIGDQSLPLISNIRSGHGGDTPSSVWNQAVYKFSAEYVEMNHVATDPERAMIVRCDVWSNDDGDVDDGATPLDDSAAIHFVYEFRLFFDDRGRPDAKQANRWSRCQRANGTVVYAPSDFTVLQRCAADRQTCGNERDEGHPFVGHGVLDLLEPAFPSLAPGGAGGTVVNLGGGWVPIDDHDWSRIYATGGRYYVGQVPANGDCFFSAIKMIRPAIGDTIDQMRTKVADRHVDATGVRAARVYASQPDWVAAAQEYQLDLHIHVFSYANPLKEEGHTRYNHGGNEVHLLFRHIPGEDEGHFDPMRP
jgi:hypothetical protein